MMLETVLVLIILGAAASYLVARAIRRGRMLFKPSSSCGSCNGCGCGEGSLKQGQPLSRMTKGNNP